MRLHQLKVDYDAEQDRLLMLVATSDGVELRLWLTRRFVKLLWPLLVKLAEEASPRIRTQANPEARKALLGLEHEHAVSKADFSKPYDAAQHATPLGEKPVLLARIQTGHDRNGQPVAAMHPSDGQGVTLTFDSVPRFSPEHFARATLLERIHRRLHARVQQYTNVHSVAPAELAAVEIKDGAALTLRDGRRISARLLVGADGADSAVRQYAGLALRRFALAQTAIVATVRTERPHDDTAFQHFLPTGPLALLPLAGAHHVSIVWSADTPRAQALMALDDVAFTAELTRAFGERLGALTVASARAAFPLALTHAVDYIAPAVALVGDAAHTVHPLAGQGVNLGLLDAAALAEVVLDAHGAGKDIGAHHVLRRYERWRKGDNWTMLAVTGGFKFLFGNDWPLVREARNLGLRATDRSQIVKNLFMRRACGLIGDVPRLARRAPLGAAP